MTERVADLSLNWDFTDFRNYDPQLGRFHQVDALADFFSTLTPYNYAYNDPVNETDPSGLCPECEKNVKNPTVGQQYVSSGDALYIYTENGWVREGGQLAEVTVTPEGEGGEAQSSETYSQASVLPLNITLGEFGRYYLKSIELTTYGVDIMTTYLQHQDKNRMMQNISKATKELNTLKSKPSQFKTATTNRNIRALTKEIRNNRKALDKLSKLGKIGAKKLFIAGVLIGLGDLATQYLEGKPTEEIIENFGWYLADTAVGLAAVLLPPLAIPALIYTGIRLGTELYKANEELSK
jgi:RHS repeat-associated protein